MNHKHGGGDRGGGTVASSVASMVLLGLRVLGAVFLGHCQWGEGKIDRDLTFQLVLRT